MYVLRDGGAGRTEAVSPAAGVLGGGGGALLAVVPGRTVPAAAGRAQAGTAAISTHRTLALYSWINNTVFSAR